MATRYVNVTGKAYWAKVFEENRDLTGWDDSLVETGGQYVVMVEADADSIHELTMARSQTVDNMKDVPVEKGSTTTVKCVKLRRDHEKYSRKGDLLEWASGAPKIVKDDGKTPWSIEDDGLLGNGTEIVARVAVYDAGKNVGTRLEAIRVVNHVPAPDMEVV